MPAPSWSGVQTPPGIAIECFKSSFFPKPASYDERNHNAIVCDTLARTYMRLRRFEEAEETIKKGLVCVFSTSETYVARISDLSLGY